MNPSTTGPQQSQADGTNDLGLILQNCVLNNLSLDLYEVLRVRHSITITENKVIQHFTKCEYEEGQECNLAVEHFLSICET